MRVVVLDLGSVVCEHLFTGLDGRGRGFERVQVGMRGGVEACLRIGGGGWPLRGLRWVGWWLL